MKILNTFNHLILFALFFALGNVVTAQAPYITIWKTDNPGESEGNEIMVPAEGSFDYAWEEVGNPGNNGNGSGINMTTISLPSPGTYSLSITPITFNRIYFNRDYDREKLMEIVQWGDVQWTNFSRAYFGCENMVISAVDIPDLTLVDSMDVAFSTTNISTVANMNNWDVSTVVTMEAMFEGCENFNEFIGDWDVSKVTDMHAMFFVAPEFNQDISSWDVSQVTDISYMFNFAANFNQDISSWNVSKVTNMASTFNSAFTFNQDIGNWDVSKVRDMNKMFYAATEFDQNIDAWDVSQVTNMSGMFNRAFEFNQSLNSWDVSNVEYMGDIFLDARNFDQSFEDWELSSVLQESEHGPNFTNTAMSCENYGLTLKGWAENPTSGDNLHLSAINLLYDSAPEIISAREYLINDLSWTIEDAGPCSDFICLFSDEKITICVGESIDFIDLSNGDIESWEWAFSGGTPASSNEQNPTITYNDAGTFDVSLTITSTTGETASFSVDGLITVVTINASVEVTQHESCTDACDGSALASGGDTYLWSNGATTAQIDNLCAGEYFVTITNDAGCSAIESIVINQGGAFNGEIVVLNHESCTDACDGSALASGGDTYLWSNGATTAQIDNLCAGEYFVTITNDAGCSSIESIIINEGGALNGEIEVLNHESCTDACDGSAIASGGDSYLWSNGATTAQIDNLCAGDYSVTISNSAGCSTIETVTIDSGSSMNANAIAFNSTSCPGACDGSALASGGDTYQWSNGATTAMANGLCAGDYSVTISNVEGCMTVLSVTIEDGLEFSAHASIRKEVSCLGACDASAYATEGHSYQWSTGETSSEINNLCEGVYYVTITNSVGCSTVDSVIIREGYEVKGSVEVLNGETCPGTCNGSAIASGGLTYQWSNGATTAQVDNLCAGEHIVTITGDRGCYDVVSIFIGTSEELEGRLNTDFISIYAGDSAIIYVDYFSDSLAVIQWETEEEFNCLREGIHCGKIVMFPTKSQTVTVILTDLNGCQIVLTVEIVIDGSSAVYIPNAFTPNDDGLNDVLKIGFGKQANQLKTLEIFDRFGGRVYQLQNVKITGNSLSTWDGYHRDKAVSQGVYIYKLLVEFTDGSTKHYKGNINLIR